ncbi:hypothetical protein [Tautonia marina]|uniref:hypothetical protein n=1 Tax=Tautonia marina TaxID=2653855 RepID=UPI001260F379|nr:hypothetical protein [Tautonia marina]
MPFSGESLTDVLASPDPIAAAALVSSDDDVPSKPDHASTLSSTLGINLGLGASADSNQAAPPGPSLRPSSPAEGGESHSHHDDSEDHSHHRSAWPMALLGSYASAMTIACGWLWWTSHRNPPPRQQAPVWAAGLDAGQEPGIDAGRREEGSAVVEPAEPIAEDRIVPLGELLSVDALEIQPLRVSVGPVELKRTRVDGRTERRDGGSDALRLHLRLRNTSDDVIFAPLDEAFVREPDRRLPETFVEDASGTRIYAYRLPVSSEWEIAGQTFQELRPGEQIETVVLSDTDSPNRLDGRLLWRLRLRTAPETTAVLGVTFNASEIRSASE